MRSRAHFKGHPLHPLLIVFPAAFTVAAPVADVLGLIGDWPSVWTTAAYLSAAAVVTGLIAGVPGFIDYLFVVPPDSSGKRRATQHMIVNLTALAAIAVGWVFRDGSSLRPGAGTLVLELAGLALISYGGWLGGTLVYRNQIGVDHRYAGAGKWKEQDVTGRPGDLVVVARTDELKANQMKLLHAGRRIVLARTESGYCAFDDHCTHRGGPLADGVLACGTVTCPWHGSQFDVTSGAVKAGPTEKPITAYAVEETAGEVRLRIPGK
ncbi:MAG TPA: DUF2231 domain-containing protein [Gemmataceae bacterium]|jgi:nitrite reductase/ring-hydroxylating ferredoxin subunit/uncharacterized membrane protein